MKSYTQSRNLYGTLTKNTTTANLTLGDQLINDSIRTVCNIRGGKWPFLETTKTVSTTASTAYVTIPQSIRKVIDVTVTVGTTVYTPTPIFSSNKWNEVLASELGESDEALFVYQVGRNLYIAPTPATSSNTVTIRGRKNITDLTVADLTTPTVTTATQGSTAIVINAGGLASMAGKYIRITNTGVANTGDGRWYEIASATATTITLVAPYEGTSIVAGTAACTIAQMSPIPEAYDMAPIYRSVAIYWGQQEGGEKKADRYWRMYDGGQEAGLSDRVGGLVGQMIENESSTLEDNYISPNGLGNVDPNDPPRDLTGF